MVAQNSTDGDREAFLAHLMRGGSVGMWWRLADKRSVWWPAARPDWATAGGIDLYFGVCPGDGSRRDGSERNTAASVAAVNAVWCDVDAKDHGGDMAAALAVVQRAPLPPSAVVNSGGGYHGYWLLAEPFQIAGDAARRAQIAGLLRRWVAAVGGDPVGDLPRILRLPGTFNGKNGGRRAVTWHSLDLSRVYSVADIEAALAAVDARQAVAQPRLPPVSSGRALPAGDEADRARRALRLLSAWRCDEYGEWVRVGMALSALGPVGLSLWDDWSRGSARYEPGACDAKWRTFGSEGVGLGTLHTRAREDDPTGYAAEFGGGRLIAAGAASVSSGPTRRADTAAAAVVRDIPAIARFETDSLPQFTPADAAALPRCFGDMIAAVARSVQRPAQMALWAGLGVVSAALGERLRWQYSGDLSGGVNLFLAMVAESGMRKTPVLRAMRRPIDLLQEEEQQAAMADVVHAQRLRKIDEKRLERIEADLAAGKVRGDDRLRLEAELRDLSDKLTLTKPPVLPLRFITGDVTPEQLLKLLSDHGRLAVLSDEGQIFDHGRKYQSAGMSNIEGLIKAFDGDAQRSDRRTEGASIVVKENTPLTVGVMVQPGRYAEWLSDTANTSRGLAQRFLVVSAEKQRGVDSTEPPEVPAATAQAYAAWVRWCATAVCGVLDWRGKAAREILHAEQREEYARAQRDGFYSDFGPVAEEWADKLFGSGTLRLAAILAAGYAYDAQEGPNAATWGAATLERAARAAVRLTALTRAHTLRQMVTGDAGGRVRDAVDLIGRYILPHFGDGSTFTRRDLLRIVGQRHSAATLAPILTMLHDRGYLLLADDGKHLDARGSLLPTARFVLHPHAAAEPDEADRGAVFDVPAATAQIAAPVAVATQPAQIAAPVAAGAAHDPRLAAWRPNADNAALADFFDPAVGEWELRVEECEWVAQTVAEMNARIVAEINGGVHHAGDQAHRER